MRFPESPNGLQKLIIREHYVIEFRHPVTKKCLHNDTWKAQMSLFQDAMAS